MFLSFPILMQVLKLKEQLSEADKQIQKLSSSISPSSSSSDQRKCCEQHGVNVSNSPSAASISMELPPGFLGDFAYEDDGVLFYMPENSYSIQCMEWLSHYV